MKKIIFILFLLPVIAKAQTVSYRESGDTIFVNNHVILPGDTIHLGMGSDPYKNFVFLMQKPRKDNVNTVTFSTPKLDNTAAFKFMIYKGKQSIGSKKHKINVPIYNIMGTDGPYAEYVISSFTGAMSAEEILGF